MRKLTVLLIGIVISSGLITAPLAAQEPLTDEQIATLNSLEKVDDHPLYTMTYTGEYEEAVQTAALPQDTGWACTLFAALADEDNRLYGRNFDWEHSPAVLLFTDPAEGYASVSLVDIAYLGFQGSRADDLLDLPVEERASLLYAPFLPFDGMNERGLVVGMAAVHDVKMPHDPGRETIGSLGVIREMLDHAATVDEAVTILESYNIDMAGGPTIHYLIADRAGNAVLVEFLDGEMIVSPNENPWHVATNFICAAVKSTAGQCPRYDAVQEQLSASVGRLSVPDALDLLDTTSQSSTQWSVVYGISTGAITLALDRHYEQVYEFQLAPAQE